MKEQFEEREVDLKEEIDTLKITVQKVKEQNSDLLEELNEAMKL